MLDKKITLKPFPTRLEFFIFLHNQLGQAQMILVVSYKLSNKQLKRTIK